MAEHAGEKSFEATPHRRQEARDKGQVAFSQDLGSAALLLLGVFLLMILGGGVMKFCAALMVHQLGNAHELVVVQEDFLHDWLRIAFQLAIVLLPILGLLMLGGVMASVLQVGFLWIPDKLSPDFSRLSPLAGLKRIFSVSGTTRLGFGLVKVFLVSAVATGVVWFRWDDVMRSAALDVPEFGKFLIDISLSTMLWSAVALVILAVMDYAVQRWKYEQDLRMTHQEVREEMKNLQGDPQVVARRRAIQRQMVLNRIASSVPKADVVITNPTELAVAIQYTPDEMAAPVVVAKGAGVIAQRIRRLALEHNIPVVERKPLAQLLYKEVDISRPIPTDSYAAVAEVLAYVYQLKGKKLPMPPKAA
ncbi:MAG: flagellar biosynthesis protein FlhB [Planctomycetes bacterium]|nr:flagellar biosynthesis protein FlhB [Planctomycetota bacterium]